MQRPLDQAPVIVAPRPARRRARAALAKLAPEVGTPMHEAALRIAEGSPISATWLARQFGRRGVGEHQRRLLGGEAMRRRSYAALDRYRLGRPMDGRWAAESR